MASEDWLFWQLVDSAFPAGGLNHSGGLEATWQLGEVGQDLQAFVRTFAVQLGMSMVPLAVAVAREPETFGMIDLRCEAMLTNPITHRASRVQGRAILSAAGRVFGDEVVAKGLKKIDPSCQPVHQAPTWGAIGAALGMGSETVGRAVLFTGVRSVISAAVRLGVVGPFEGQAIQFALKDDLEAIAQRGSALTIDEASHTAPVIDVAGAQQDRLYSRLFVS